MAEQQQMISEINDRICTYTYTGHAQDPRSTELLFYSEKGGMRRKAGFLFLKNTR